ncbi:MAG: DUF3592 domain-containing protein [Gloeomargarita sp. GMQP_bins_120]
MAAFMFRLVFCLIGLAMLGFAGWDAHRTWQFVQVAAKTTGEVVDLERQRLADEDYDDHYAYRRYRYSGRIGHRRSVSYYPVVVYTLPDGRRLEVVARTGSTPPRYRIGQRVEVLYDPQNPSRARINDFFELWLLPLFFGGFGLFFTIGGLVAPVSSNTVR